MGSIDMEWKPLKDAPALGKLEVLLRRTKEGERTAIAERREGRWFVDGVSVLPLGWRQRK